MTLGRRAVLAGSAALATRAAWGQQSAGLRDLARRVTLYLTPLAILYARRFHDTVDAGHKLNRLVRQAAPEDGVLDAAAWLDLSGEPLFLTLPAMGERFYSAALLDPFTNNFAHVSSRLSGDTPQPHLIAGPGWTGDAPSDVTVLRAPAKSVWLRLRIAVGDDGGDLDAARALQVRSLLETPDQRNERRIIEVHELMRYRTYAPAEPVSDWPAPRPSERFDLFETGLAMLGECVLSNADRALLEDLAPLHLHAGHRFDVHAFTEQERGEIAQGMTDAETEIAAAGPRFGETVEGWRYPAPDLGAFGADYLYRAFIATTALGAPRPAEILDLTTDALGTLALPSPLPARAFRWLAGRRTARFFQPDAALLDGRYRLDALKPD